MFNDMRKNNKRNKTPIEINKEKAENKKLLIEKMKTASVSGVNSKSISPSKDILKTKKQTHKMKEQHDSRIKKLELLILKSNKENDLLREELKVSRKTLDNKIEENEVRISEIIKNHDEITKNLKQDNLRQIENFQLKIHDLNNNIEQYNDMITELENKITSIQEENKLLSEGEIVNTVKTLRREINISNGEAKHYLGIYKDLIERNKKLVQEFGSLKGDFNNKLLREKERLKSKEKELQQEIDKIKMEKIDSHKKLNVKNLINVLTKNMKEDNVYSYHNELLLLNRKHGEIIELANRRIEEERDRLTLLKKEENKSWVIDNSLIGYLGRDKDDEWYFYTIDNIMHLVTASKVPELIPDIPARAIITDGGSAYIVYCFYDTPNSTDETQTIEKKLIKTKPKQNGDDGEFLYFGDFSILIVGSQRKQSYMWRGQKHGLNVIWHDPYEEHESVLKSKLKTCDIAIINARHVPHSVMDIIDKNDQKVQVMERDSEDTIMARIRYTAIRLGLISVNYDN